MATTTLIRQEYRESSSPWRCGETQSPGHSSTPSRQIICGLLAAYASIVLVAVLVYLVVCEVVIAPHSGGLENNSIGDTGPRYPAVSTIEIRPAATGIQDQIPATRQRIAMLWPGPDIPAVSGTVPGIDRETGRSA